jgi:hypothetical protein
MTDAQLTKIKERMQNHDWFFEFADDQTQWRRGSSEREDILRLAQQIPASQLPELLELVPDELKELWSIALRRAVR